MKGRQQTWLSQCASGVVVVGVSWGRGELKLCTLAVCAFWVVAACVPEVLVVRASGVVLLWL
jgi:hypothetical protein